MKNKEIKQVAVRFPTGSGFYMVHINLDKSNPWVCFYNEADLECCPEDSVPWVDADSCHLGGGEKIALSYDKNDEMFDEQHDIIEKYIINKPG